MCFANTYALFDSVTMTCNCRKLVLVSACFWKVTKGFTQVFFGYFRAITDLSFCSGILLLAVVFIHNKVSVFLFFFFFPVLIIVSLQKPTLSSFQQWGRICEVWFCICMLMSQWWKDKSQVWHGCCSLPVIRATFDLPAGDSHRLVHRCHTTCQHDWRPPE